MMNLSPRRNHNNRHTPEKSSTSHHSGVALNPIKNIDKRKDVVISAYTNINLNKFAKGIRRQGRDIPGQRQSVWVRAKETRCILLAFSNIPAVITKCIESDLFSWSCDIKSAVYRVVNVGRKFPKPQKRVVTPQILLRYCGRIRPPVTSQENQIRPSSPWRKFLEMT